MHYICVLNFRALTIAQINTAINDSEFYSHVKITD